MREPNSGIDDVQRSRFRFSLASLLKFFLICALFSSPPLGYAVWGWIVAPLILASAILGVLFLLQWPLMWCVGRIVGSSKNVEADRSERGSHRG